MRAAVITAPGQVEVTDLPDPTPGHREVVVAVAGCGICGTDLHIRDGEFAPTLPVVPGHEFAGEVVAVGAEVTEVAVGDRVAVDPSLYCHECHYCRIGRDNLCERWGAIGVTVAGGAAEYVAVPAANCVRLPAGFPVADAALVEPLSCAVHAFDRLPGRQGDSYLIYGAGTMGLIILEMAKRAGASRIDLVDVSPARLPTARQLGCSAAVGSADELEAPRGWDVVIDCTGVVAAIEDGLDRVGKGGTYLQFGVPGEQVRARFSPYRTYHEEITILGSMAVLHSFDRAADLFVGGLLDADVLISDRLPLERYPEAMDTLAAGVGRKIQVVPNPA